ncbi:MAG: phytoene desaturase [Saprospiraceae bacterium]|nr:phytoene desaturase [Saprospiraceae bacterium]
MKIGIIGAGIAGLAAAVRMAAHGYEVDVFEANPYPGGKLSEFRLGGYRFDAGPSLFTMPMYVDELYRLADPAKTPPLSYRRLDVVCHYFWEDGVRLHAHAAPEEFAREAADVLGVDPQAILRALADSRRKYELTGRTFLERSLHRPATWLSREVGSALLQLPSLDIFQSMHQVNQRQLQHPKLVQLFDRFATYNGSNPYRAPGILNIIPHFEHHFGAYFPQGGMHAITDHLYRLALEGGVRFHFEQPVSEIQVEKGRASALVVGERTLRYDRIVSNMDVFFTYRRLLPGQKAPERILAQEKSTSALIFYWGIRKEFPELGLHNIFFSEDYREEFDLLGRGRISDDPTVYVNITQKYESGDAPAGCENWFTMINVPYNSGQDWDALIARSRKNVLDKLSRILGRAIEPLIEEEALLDPRTIESRTNSHLGALYGTSSNDRMAAFLRHANFSSRIEDLYFCGGSVHPGGGIPLCLLSARIVDQLMHD